MFSYTNNIISGNQTNHDSHLDFTSLMISFFSEKKNDLKREVLGANIKFQKKKNNNMFSCIPTPARSLITNELLQLNALINARCLFSQCQSGAQACTWALARSHNYYYSIQKKKATVIRMMYASVKYSWGLSGK